jgi:glycerate kinase
LTNPTTIPRTVLIAVEPFGEGLSAQRAGAAIGQGLRAGDPSLGIDLCPIEPTVPEDFDARMRAARAVVVGAGRLDEHTLAETGTRAGGACLPASAGSATFEIATRARQAGVPAYAVSAENDLSLFDARILDLQVVLQARDTRALRGAGEKLAGVV